MSSPRRVVYLRVGTDGDPSHTPKAGTYQQVDPPTLYLEKLGDLWMKARGEAQGNIKSIEPGMDTRQVDEEGTPDVVSNLLNELRRNPTKELDEFIQEPMSLDWRAEQQLLPDLDKAKCNPQCIPRTGDVVLFVRQLLENVNILRHPITGDYRMYDEHSKQWLERPTWEAGLVTEVPTKPSEISDLSTIGEQEGNVTSFGVRVEPLPDVNSTDKPLTKRHKYVPLRNVRPFLLWKDFLHRVQESDWHPTIFNALKAAATVSPINRYRFRSVWPKATVYHRGIHNGHEKLVVGDVVRLSPNSSRRETRSTDILVIKSIRLEITNLDKASENDWDNGKPYRQAYWICGAAFTSDPSQAKKEYLSDARPPAIAKDYGEWYPLHPPNKDMQVPHGRVIGRLFERDAIPEWLNNAVLANRQALDVSNHHLLDIGCEAILESREIARRRDNRLTQSEEVFPWFWADNRAHALDLHTINGLDVSAHDPLRDPKDWRRKINKGFIETNEKKAVPAATSTGVSALTRRNFQAFMAPTLSDLPDRSHGSRTAMTSDVDISGAGSSPATRLSRKRSFDTVEQSSDTVEQSSDVDEENTDDEINKEIRESTRMVEDDNSKPKAKKPRVAVVVDRN
ncbi:hypothetical protein E8E13_008394 [Curvularia kusanoi]|uniref:Cryptic loci regulator 2 C-terminal domain-containing protein n=1 Tax=Curvularia kusanoi TaxID=90978 RepID=A0A9P4TF73_CURKU|nr:hypothetical protein E8E13_008394 [Curvularia kusanoi]